MKNGMTSSHVTLRTCDYRIITRVHYLRRLNSLIDVTTSYNSVLDQIKTRQIRKGNTNIYSDYAAVQVPTLCGCV
jgi:hypothetical protein